MTLVNARAIHSVYLENLILLVVLVPESKSAFLLDDPDQDQ